MLQGPRVAMIAYYHMTRKRVIPPNPIPIKKDTSIDLGILHGHFIQKDITSKSFNKWTIFLDLKGKYIIGLEQ